MNERLRSFLLIFCLNIALNFVAIGSIILFAEYGLAPFIILVKSGMLVFPPIHEVLVSLKGGAAAGVVVAFVITTAATLKAR